MAVAETVTDGVASAGASAGASAVAALEIAAARAWPAPISRRLGDWWLRSADGFTGRANSALPIGESGLPATEALASIVAFYRSVGHPPYIDAPLPSAHAIADAAVAEGWHVACTVLVQTAEIDPLLAAAAATTATAQPGCEPPDCTLLDRPSGDHLARIAVARGPLPPAAVHVLTAVDQVTFAEIRDGGTLIGRARGTVTDGRLGLFAIETAPEARRRGIGVALIGRLALWARDLGATSAYLQVEDHNAAAIALYAKLGFATHHRYVRLAGPVS